jgi:hypothetical protein
MAEKIYTTLWQLYCDIREQAILHKSQLIADSDKKRLLIGWTCVNSGDHFYVRLANIKRRTALELPFENPALHKWLTELLISEPGRDRIASLLSWGGTGTESSAQEIFERIFNLKAFW